MLASLFQEISVPDAAAILLFYAFAAMAGGSAIGVAMTRNVVRMAVFLMFTLAGVAGLYFTLDAEFLAAVQLVIYVGGTLILIVFGVMLTNKSPAGQFEPKAREVALALVIGIALLAAIVLGLHSAATKGAFANHAIPTGEYPMQQLGQALMSDFLIPFEVVSVLLLVVMIGAAYLAKARKRAKRGAE